MVFRGREIPVLKPAKLKRGYFFRECHVWRSRSGVQYDYKLYCRRRGLQKALLKASSLWTSTLSLPPLANRKLKGGLWGASLCIEGRTGQSDPESKRCCGGGSLKPFGARIGLKRWTRTCRKRAIRVVLEPRCK